MPWWCTEWGASERDLLNVAHSCESCNDYAGSITDLATARYSQSINEPTTSVEQICGSGTEDSDPSEAEHMTSIQSLSTRCIFGTCQQPASYRVNRPGVEMPLCPVHQRLLALEGVPTERLVLPAQRHAATPPAALQV